MFSKIGNSSTLTPQKKDSIPTHESSAVRQAEREEGRYKKNEGRKKQEEGAAGAFTEDAMSFSVQALRALLRQENVADSDIVFRHLDLLEGNGVISVPIRENQSIPEAIALAASYLGTVS